MANNAIWFDEQLGPIYWCLDVADAILKACSQGTKQRESEREERDESKQALLSPLLCTLSHANRQEINPLWLIRTASGVSSAHLCPVASDTHTQVAYIAFRFKD